MIKRAVMALAAVGVLGLAGCETATPYQPLAAHNAVPGGFSDQRVDDTHFRVVFKGNDVTSRMQVENYLLYRAADVTVGAGFDWFEMVDHSTHNTGETYVSPAFGPGWGYWRPDWAFGRRGRFGAWGGVGWDAYDVNEFDRYQATADIFVGHGPKPANDPRAFDARQVMTNLGPKIVRPS
jgi:hypothetical protein